MSSSFVLVQNLKLDILKLDSYKNNTKNISFKLIDISKNLEIKNIDYEYEVYDELDVINANVKIENTTFTNKLFNNALWGAINKKRFTGSQKIFRDLKNLAENSKNFMDAAAFSSLEMKAKREDLIEEKKKLKSLDEQFVYWSNILLFSIYEWVSNYGLNWKYPLLLMFYFSGLCYLLDIYNINIWHAVPIIFISMILTKILSEFSCLFVGKYLNYQVLWWMSTVFLVGVFLLICVDDLSKVNSTVTFTKHISPFGLFKDGSENIEFSIFVQKLVILFLAYQVFLGVKKNIRSK